MSISLYRLENSPQNEISPLVWGIAQVKDAVWPAQKTPPSYIAEVVAQPDHLTWVALDGTAVVGFVDGFLTLAHDGTRRLEVDLCAVLPAYQGQGIGKRLIEAITQEETAVAFARALIRQANKASQQAFAACGYQPITEDLHLYVSNLLPENTYHQGPDSRQMPPNGYFLPVITLDYQGAWLEGEISLAGLQAAQAICRHMGWSQPGALLPATNIQWHEWAKRTGYEMVGVFRWWAYPITPVLFSQAKRFAKKEEAL